MLRTYVLRVLRYVLRGALHRALHAKPRYSLTHHSLHVMHYATHTTHYALHTTHTTHHASRARHMARGIHSVRGLQNQEKRLALFVFLASLASDCLAARLYSSIQQANAELHSYTTPHRSTFHALHQH